MNFTVDKRVFETMPTAIFGVVVARGIDNKADYPRIRALLEEGVKSAEARYLDKKVKEDAAILPYREAFLRLNINPNKFMSSIEAMFTRVSKGKGLPSINPIVDLGNALSLKYVLPMGAHDMCRMDADMEVRYSNAGDSFLPFGESETETMPEGELVYVVGNKIRTRRWIWRQSELGKIDGESRDIFYPIDGFSDANKDAVLRAREELERLLHEIFGCEVKSGFVDADNNVMEL